MAFEFLDNEQRKGLILGSIASGLISAAVAGSSGANPAAAAAVGMGNAFTSGIDTIAKMRHAEIDKQKQEEMIAASKDRRAYMKKHLSLEELKADLQKQHYSNLERTANEAQRIRESREAREGRKEAGETASRQALAQYIQTATATDEMGAPSSEAARASLAHYTGSLRPTELSAAHAIVADLQRKEAQEETRRFREEQASLTREDLAQRRKEQQDFQKLMLGTKAEQKKAEKAEEDVTVRNEKSGEVKTVPRKEAKVLFKSGPWVEANKPPAHPPAKKEDDLSELIRIMGEAKKAENEKKGLAGPGPTTAREFQFLGQFDKGAPVTVYVVKGKKYRIPASKQREFLKDHPEATQEIQ